jgi:hypothetical protein
MAALTAMRASSTRRTLNLQQATIQFPLAQEEQNVTGADRLLLMPLLFTLAPSSRTKLRKQGRCYPYFWLLAPIVRTPGALTRWTLHPAQLKS